MYVIYSHDLSWREIVEFKREITQKKEQKPLNLDRKATVGWIPKARRRGPVLIPSSQYLTFRSPMIMGNKLCHVLFDVFCVF